MSINVRTTTCNDQLSFELKEGYTALDLKKDVCLKLKLNFDSLNIKLILKGKNLEDTSDLGKMNGENVIFIAKEKDIIITEQKVENKNITNLAKYVISSSVSLITSNKKSFLKLLKTNPDKVKITEEMLEEVSEEVTKILGDKPQSPEGLLLTMGENDIGDIRNMEIGSMGGVNGLMQLLMNPGSRRMFQNVVPQQAEENDETDLENIKSIVDMGFTDEEATRAYNTCGKNIEGAIAKLIGN